MLVFRLGDKTSEKVFKTIAGEANFAAICFSRHPEDEMIDKFWCSDEAQTTEDDNIDDTTTTTANKDSTSSDQ